MGHLARFPCIAAPCELSLICTPKVGHKDKVDEKE
jgi:hypothetical protein